MSRRPPCPYRPPCPGCPRFEEPQLDPAQIARLEELSRSFRGPSVEQFPFEGRGHRHRVRLSVRGRVGDCRVGIFEAGSHQLVHIPRCPVHHPAIESLLLDFVPLLNESEISPYDEVAHSGILRGVQMAVQRETGRVQVVLLINDDLSEDVLRFPTVQHVVAGLERSPNVHSLFLGALPEKTNSLFPRKFRLCRGSAMMSDSVGSTKVFFPPDAFGQANPIQHERAVQRIHGFVRPGERVVEYYCGVGTIGLGLASRGETVLFNELGEGSANGLRKGWEELGRSAQELSFSQGPAGSNVDLYQPGDTVIVDPPRKGLDASLLERLKREPPRRLIYLSCGLDALVRESSTLRQQGALSLEHVSAWAYFPFTRHVESLLVFSRPQKRRGTAE